MAEAETNGLDAREPSEQLPIFVQIVYESQQIPAQLGSARPANALHLHTPALVSMTATSGRSHCSASAARVTPAAAALPCSFLVFPAEAVTCHARRP